MQRALSVCDDANGEPFGIEAGLTRWPLERPMITRLVHCSTGGDRVGDAFSWQVFEIWAGFSSALRERVGARRGWFIMRTVRSSRTGTIERFCNVTAQCPNFFRADLLTRLF